MKLLVARLAGAAALAALVGGCSGVSHVIADNWPRALGGLPEGVPPRLDTPPAYMPVHDMPPARDTKKMTPQERAKFEADMAASRNQNSREAQELKTEAPERLPPIHGSTSRRAWHGCEAGRFIGRFAREYSNKSWPAPVLFRIILDERAARVRNSTCFAT